MMKIIFLDRDGVLNRYPGDTKYVTKLSEFKFLPYAKKAIAMLTKKNFNIFVISNQAGVSKGIYSHKTLNEITLYMLKGIGDVGGKIKGVYYCLHQDRDNCLCRKPKTGLIYQALKENNINKSHLRKAFFVGDSIRDMATAYHAGMRSILVFSGREKSKNKTDWHVQPDYTAKDLLRAVELILKRIDSRE